MGDSNLTYYFISVRRLQASMGDCEPQDRLRRSCLILRDLASPTADLSRDACSGGAAEAMCRSKHLKAPRTVDSDGAAGSVGRRSCVNSERIIWGPPLVSDY